MRKTAIIFIVFLLFVLIISPLNAIDVDSLNSNNSGIYSVKDVQEVRVSEQAAPKSSSEFAMESPVDPKNYKLGPGDLLGVHIIVGDSELSVDHSLLVGADGKVFFPNIGEIYLSGLNLVDAKSKLDSKIKSVYKESYKLSVLLVQPKKVKIYLSGMVKNPGPLTVYDNLRVSEIISQAGGVVSGASNRYVYIKRIGPDGKEKLLIADLFEAYRSRDISKDIRIEAGDIIDVPDSENFLISKNKEKDNSNKLLFEGKETFVYVYGDVARSGRFEYIPGKRLSDYISFAGGPTGRALLSGVTVTRQIDNKSYKYNINAADVVYNGNYKNDIEIVGGDVVFVPGNFFYVSDFSNFANTVLLGFTLYSTLVRK